MHFRRPWAVVSALVLAVILVATLTPSPGTPVTASIWCIACGEHGGVDVAANIIMFVPLGVALALTTGRRWVSVAACVIITLAIELLQVRVVLGRDASVSDLLANSLGGAIGAELALRRHLLLRPRAPAAAWLAGLAAAAFAAACALTSVGLEPASVPRSLWIQWTPPRASYEPFTGRVLAFDVDGIPLPLGFPSPSLGLDRVLSGPQWQATTTIATDGLEPRRSVIVRIAEEFTVLVSVEQSRRDLVCLQKTKASDFRFRSPKAVARDAFDFAGSEGSTATPSVAKLVCARRHAWLVAGVDGREERLRLSPSLGWLLLSPFDVTVSGSTSWAGLLWLLALAFPAGYWAGQLRADAGTARRRLVLTSAAIGALFGAGLWFAPLVTSVSPANVREWGAALLGLAIGVAIGRAVSLPWPHLLHATPSNRIRA